MNKPSIALIGFMATGKTSVGEALAKKLNYKFIETDKVIEEEAGKSIPKIFAEDGEVLFREYEIAACKKVSQYNSYVISCGGGAVLNKINIDYLRKKCHIVLLTASIEEIYSRIMKDGKETRPVINKHEPKKEIREVLKFREPFYKAAAEIIIDTTGKPFDEIIEEIITKIKVKN